MVFQLKAGDPIVVATREKSIFFGYFVSRDGVTRLTLRGARQCVYYSRETHGYAGLAARGPMHGSRIGPAVEIEIGNVVHIIRASESAVRQWETEPWEQ